MAPSNRRPDGGWSRAGYEADCDGGDEKSLAFATLFVPIAMAPVKSPSALATLLGPSASAKLRGVLAQPVTNVNAADRRACCVGRPDPAK